MENLKLLIQELCKYPTETEWLEFKHNNYDPDMIGTDISALANSAAIHEKNCAYMLWGVGNDDHNIVGTDFDLKTLKKGNEELENWLRGNLSKNADFEFDSTDFQNGDKTVKIGILKICKATSIPVSFRKEEYIRVGSYTKKLKDYPAIQSQLWKRLHNECFEDLYAVQDLQLTEALQLLDYTVYFDIKKESLPTDVIGIAHYLLEEGILEKTDNGLYAVTNLGAILLGKRLTDFPRISRKALRVVEYDGNNRLDMLREETFNKGYVNSLLDSISFIKAVTPTKEEITDVLRENKTAYPGIALREAVANAIIHQDFSETGTGPVVEIFSNRIEITNPGIPLIEVVRIVDNPPKSRNEKLATLMRRLKMCEELGTGWDKIVIACELAQLPAPKIETYEESTKVIMYSNMPFANIAPEDKLWACYLHACIKQVQGEQLTNKSLRERFGLKESSSGMISRLIRDAVEKGLIKPLDPDTAPRYMKYIPFWA